MKTALLIDINDTLDDHSNHEEVDRINKSPLDSLERQLQLNGVMPIAEGIEVFSSFLKEYNERIIPIFWTSVGLHGQSLLARQYFPSSSIVGNSAGEFIPDIRNYDLNNCRKIGIGSPKSKYMPCLLEFIKGKADRIIWFEDSIRGADQEYVDAHDNIDHVGVRLHTPPYDTLKDRTKEIKRLIA